MKPNAHGKRCVMCNAYLRGAYLRLDSDDPRHERYEAECRQGHVVRITVRKIEGTEEGAERKAESL